MSIIQRACSLTVYESANDLEVVGSSPKETKNVNNCVVVVKTCLFKKKKNVNYTHFSLHDFKKCIFFFSFVYICKHIQFIYI